MARTSPPMIRRQRHISDTAEFKEGSMLRYDNDVMEYTVRRSDTAKEPRIRHEAKALVADDDQDVLLTWSSSMSCFPT